LWTEIRSALAQASENVRHGRSPFELTMRPSRGAASEALPSFAGFVIKQRDQVRALRMTLSIASAIAL